MKETSVSKVGHYRSWYDIARKLEKSEDRLAFYDAIDAYRFDGVEPEGLPPIVELLWIAIKPNIDADIGCRVFGAKGGKADKKEGGEKLSNGSILPPLEEISNPPFENSSSNVDVDVDVDADVDGGLIAPKAPVSVENSAKDVENWFASKNLTLSGKDLKRITGYLVSNSKGLDYLEYVLDYISSKTYKARGKEGRVLYAELSEGNKRGMLLDAVLNWQELPYGYKDWHRNKKEESRRKKAALKKNPPSVCPSCNSGIILRGDVAMCNKCNGYLEQKGKSWSLVPFETRTLSECFIPNGEVI